MLDPVRDDYLNCADDYGLAGLALALVFIVAATVKFFRPLWLDSRWQDRVLVATGFAAWVALLVHSLVDFNLHIPANALLLFALTGLALGRIKEEKPGNWSALSLNPLGRWLGGVVLLLGLVYGVEVWRTAMSDTIYETALGRMDVVPFSESLDNATAALGYDAGNVQAWVFAGDVHRLRGEIEKDSASRLAEGQKALEAFQQALRMNPLDRAVQARIDATRAWMQKDAVAPVPALPASGQ